MEDTIMAYIAIGVLVVLYVFALLCIYIERRCNDSDSEETEVRVRRHVYIGNVPKHTVSKPTIPTDEDTQVGMKSVFQI